MNVTLESSGNLLIAYLFGEIDHHTAVAVRSQIDSAIQDKLPGHLILDFKNVTFMDSSGIGLVMGRYRLSRHGGDQECDRPHQKDYGAGGAGEHCTDKGERR